MKLIMKRCGIGTILLLLIIGILTTYIPISAKTSRIGLSEFEVSVNCGVNGIIKMNQTIPVDITVKCKKKDFNGSIKCIFIDTQNGYDLNYESALKLSQNEEKTISFTTSGYGNYYRIQLYDEKNDIVYQNEYSIAKTIDSYSAVVGILSEKCEKLDYFKDIELVHTNLITTSTLYLDANNFPKNLHAMEVMDYLIIDDFATEKLSQKQYDVIEQWVQNGGSLIIALGDNYEKSYQLFQQNYPITTQNITETMQLKQDKSITVSGVKIQSEEWQQTELLNLKEMYCQRKIGKGSISLLGFCLSDNAVVNDVDNQILAEAILTSCASTLDKLYNKVSSYFDSYEVDHAISFWHDVKAINIAYYMIILIFYVLIIGPGLYIFFKKKNKMQGVYIGVGVIAIAFTILLGVTTYNKRVKSDIFTSLTIFDDGSNQDADIYNSYLPTKYGNIDICYNSEVYDITLPETELFNYDMEYLAENKSNKSVVVQGENVVYAKENAASFEKIITKTKLKDSCNYQTLECNLKAGQSSVNGTIKNVSQYDLEDVIVYYLGSYIRIPELKKDEEYSIKSTDSMKPVQTQKLSGYFSDTGMRQNNVVADNDKVLDYIYSHNISQTSNTYVYVFGIVKDYKADYVKGNAKEYNKAVVMTKERSDYMEFASYFVDAGNNLLMDSSDEWVVGTDGKMYEYDEGYCTYQIDTDLKVVSLRLSEPVDESKLLMKLYNYNTGGYDDVFQNGKMILSNQELNAYFNEGEFKIQYVSVLGRKQAESRQGFEVPRIDILAANKDE